MNRFVASLAFASASLIASSVVAQKAQTPPESGAPVIAKSVPATPKTPEQTGPFTYDINDRFWAELADTPNAETGQTNTNEAVYHKLAIELAGKWDTFQFKLSGEFLRGEVADGLYEDPPDERGESGTRPNNSWTSSRNVADPFEAWVGWQPGVFGLRAGLMKSHFGMGIVANDGREGKWDLFNQRYGADRGLRVVLGTRPGGMSKNRILKNITVAVAGDYVYRDDIGSLLDGDKIAQFLTTIFYRDQDPANADNATFVGLYFAYRNQEDRQIEGIEPNDEITAIAIDLAGIKSWTRGDWWFKTAAEGALISGSTSRAYTNTLEDETAILGLGATADVIVRHAPSEFALRFLTGYASGDANPDDDTLYRFRFDPNYKVGLVLYDFYLPSVSRASYNNATDPDRSGQAPKGVFGLLNDGQLQNTIYLNPQVMFGDPDGLMTGVGMLWAWSAVPLADPYNSFENGGPLVGPNGGKASQDLGTELNVAVQWKYDLINRLDLDLKAEYGVLFPGDAFDDAFGNSANANSVVRGRVGLNW